MLKINHDKGSVLIPSIDDLGMASFLSLMDSKTPYDRVKAVIGEQADSLPADDRVMETVFAFVNQLLSDVELFLTDPYKVPHIILETPISLPGDIKHLPYWPITRAKAIIQQMGDQPFNAYPMYLDLVGHYTYTTVTGQVYNEYKAEEYCKDIENTNFRIIIQLGDFFLHRHQSCWMPKLKSLSTNLTLKSKRLASIFSTNLATSTY